MEIEFQGQYSKSIIVEAVSLANKPTKRNSIIRIGITVLFVVIYVVYFFTVAMQEDISSFETMRVGRHLITLPFIAYFLAQPYISSYMIARTLWKSPSMQKPLSGFISSNGITYISSANTRREFAWESFAKRQITDTLLVLLTADGTLAFFPRHFFKTEEDWNRVKQWVLGKVVEAI